jgi:hypothetical protein
MEGLYYLMEDFIINEVNQDIYDENEKNAARARRRLKRNLNKELAPFVNEENEETNTTPDKNTDQAKINESISESENESPYKKPKYDYSETIIISQRHVDICIGVTFVCVLITFYGSIIYIVQSYSNHLNSINLNNTC